MKAFVFIAAGLGLAGLAYFLVPRKSAPSPSAAVSQRPPSPAAVKIEPAEVFRRAFWQLPGAGDKILHAERREWSDADGVKKWQWFLVVEPSPELVKYLRQDNAFGLVPGRPLPDLVGAPDWFTLRLGEVDILRAPHGNLHLFFDKTNSLLLATSSGAGFRPGAPEPAEPAPVPQATSGRIPLTPPPKN